MSVLFDESARGVFAIMATPFGDAGEIDWNSADRLVDFYLECGVHGLTVLGMMGEAPNLSAEESEMFAARCIKRIGGRVPVIVGVSNPGLKLLGEFSRKVMGDGAAGVMLTPIQGLQTEDQIYAYFQNVARELQQIPVVVQNYPQTVQVHMSVAVLNLLFRDFPTFKMLKHEEAPSLRKLSRLRATQAERGRRISIVGGNGAIQMVQELRRGADGIMTGFAFPEMLVGVYERFVAGDEEAAEDLYDAYLPVVRHEQQFGIGLALRKETLRRRGILASAAVRQPGPSLDAIDHQELTHLLGRLDLALGRLGIQPVRYPAR